MTCDNIPGNGHVTENAVAGLAELADPELAAWIRKTVAFPNSMVDRITPATSQRERDLLRDQDNSAIRMDSWHFNRAGHRVLAERLERVVLDGLAPRTTP